MQDPHLEDDRIERANVHRRQMLSLERKQQQQRRLADGPSLLGNRHRRIAAANTGGHDTPKFSSRAQGRNMRNLSESGVGSGDLLDSRSGGGSGSFHDDPAAALRRKILQSSGDIINTNSSFDGSPRLNRTGGRKEVCISPSHPLVTCDPKQDSRTYTGFMVRYEGVATDKVKVICCVRKCSIKNMAKVTLCRSQLVTLSST